MGDSPAKPKSRAAEVREIPQTLGEWAGGEIPPGWEPIAELCRRIHGRFAATVDLIVGRIIEEVPYYRSGDAPVGFADIRVSVGANLDMMLRGIATHRGPRAAELAERRELGTERAIQGVPVTALLEAFVVGYRVIWDELVRETRDEDPAIRELLLTAAATVWLWVHEVVDEVGTAYHERMRRGVALVSAVRERFFDALLRRSFDADEVGVLAQTLGFDPARSFVASAFVGGADAEELLERRMPAAPGRHHVVRRAGELLVLHQGGAPIAVDDRPMGVGAAREGLLGAAASLQDARLALALALRTGEATDFTHDWHAATLLAAEARLGPLLADGIEQARRSPDVAETIRVFAASGFSMSETARRMHLHTNTVAYRLTRWTELTGWNPRTFDGLTRSMTALTLLGED